MTEIGEYFEGRLEANPPEVSYNWVDITQNFFKNIQDLELGELVHDGQLFGLFEAMSAIEMMDPKMDAGMLCNRGHAKPLNFQQAVAAGKLKIENLEAHELIGIMDGLLACVVAWLEGHSLAQTVFTCLYMHRPLAVRDRALRAFCVAVYKLVDAVRDCINKALVFEEEDFQPMTYGYRLDELPEPQAVALLREQEDALARRAAADGSEAWAGVAARLRLARALAQALAGAPRGPQPDTPALLAAAADALKVVAASAVLGTPPPDDERPNAIGFEPLVNQRLLPPTFPRCTRLPPRAHAHAALAALLGRLRRAPRVAALTDYHSALDFFMEFSRSGACTLSRSVLQLAYARGAAAAGGAASLVDALRESLRTLTGQAATPPVERFLVRCGRPLAALLQLCGHNRARQRDKLALLLDDLAALQDDADAAGAHCATWLLYLVLRVMTAHLLAGLELELYAPHEYHYIFWYLSEFLYGWLASCAARAQALQAAASAARGPEKRGRRARKPHPLQREAALCRVLQNMCAGYYKALVGLRSAGLVRAPQSPFDSEAVRYKHRLGALAALTPPQVHYHEYMEITRPLQLQSPVLLYVEACKHFQTARALLDAIAAPDHETTALARVAKTNFVVLKLAAGGHARAPSFDFTAHMHFPIIRL